VPVDALLAQDGDRGSRTGGNVRGGDVDIRIETELRHKARIGGVEQAVVLLVGGVGVVAQPLQRVRRRRPRPVQVDPRLVEHPRAVLRDAYALVERRPP
jgi:hypothetical protein